VKIIQEASHCSPNIIQSMHQGESSYKDVFWMVMEPWLGPPCITKMDGLVLKSEVEAIKVKTFTEATM
jgi:hypothetical protein